MSQHHVSWCCFDLDLGDFGVSFFATTLRYRELGTDEIGTILKFWFEDRSLFCTGYKKDLTRDPQRWELSCLPQKRWFLSHGTAVHG